MVQKRELESESGVAQAAEAGLSKKAKGNEDTEAALALATLADAATSKITQTTDESLSNEASLSPKRASLTVERRESADHTASEEKSVASITTDMIDSILASGDATDDTDSPAPVTPDKKNIEDVRSRRVHFAPGVKEANNSRIIQTLALPQRYSMPPPRSMARGAPRMFVHYASGGHQYSFPGPRPHEPYPQDYAYPRSYLHHYARSHLHPIHHPLSPEQRSDHHNMSPPRAAAAAYQSVDSVGTNAYQRHPYYHHPLSPMPQYHQDPAVASPIPKDSALSPTTTSPSKKDDSSSSLLTNAKTPAPSENEGPTPWVCDFCRVASFSSYEEACAHESTCHARVSAANVAGKAKDTEDKNPHSNFHPRPHATYYNSNYAGAAVLPTLKPPAEETRPVYHDASWEARREGPFVAMPVEATDKAPWGKGSSSLSIPERDKAWLPELQCLMRDLCVEVFSATPEQSNTRRVSTGRVGIRCQFCAKTTDEDNGAVSFPANTANIYDAVKQWQNFHLDRCTGVSLDVKGKLVTMRANTKASPEMADTPKVRQYWTASARALGMADTLDGIRFGRDPMSPPDLAELDSYMQTSDPRDMPRPSPGVEPCSEESQCLLSADEDLNIPPYVFFMIRQMEKCVFTEADRFVARSKGPLGYPGFRCRHCRGHAGLGKYFPQTVKSLSTNSTSQNIHAHLLKCRKVPVSAKQELLRLKEEKDKAPRLEPGWRRVFFDMIWDRLHHHHNVGGDAASYQV